MRKGFLRVAFISLIASACSYQAEDSTAGKKSADAIPFSGDVAHKCFDSQMNTWIEKFNEYQQKGFDMFAADVKAKEAALRAFHACSDKHVGLATGHARKD
jgi:hypothetical protein